MEFAEQVKSQVDIVRTVGEYVRLRRAGTRWVGLCPFHSEKTPSFGVTPSLGIFKCFGCGQGGDVIRFIQEIEQITFWEALKALAERNGIPIPQQRRDPDDAGAQMRAALYGMYETAAKVFAENLFGAAGADAREYLIQRGLTGSVAQQFGLGLSEPGWDNLVRRIGRNYTAAELESSGLFSRREDGSFFDKFRGRLMFPIHNEAGKVIAFGGRALKPDDEPKYLNSPETPIYRKSSVLYNVHRAKETVRKDGRAILVEGYMDVIGVYAAGVHNVVASCGTALTPAQVRAIKRHSDNIVINFDPDTAGANATERSLQMLLDEGMHVRVLELEAGLDPDEFIRKYGADSYATRLNQSAGYFLWLADRARRKYGSASAEARMKGYEELLLPAIRRISDRLERATVATEVAEYLGLERNLVLAEFRRMAGSVRNARAESHGLNEIPVSERVLLRSMVVSREARELVLPALGISTAVQSYKVWPLLELLIALYEKNPAFSLEDVENMASAAQKELLSNVLLADKSSEVFNAGQARTFLELLRSADLEAQEKELIRSLKQAERSGNLGLAMELSQQRDELRKRISRVSPG